MVEQKRVLVVGAGAAGIWQSAELALLIARCVPRTLHRGPKHSVFMHAGTACAWSLSRYPERFDVHVWEALPTPGGVASSCKIKNGERGARRMIQGMLMQQARAACRSCSGSGAVEPGRPLAFPAVVRVPHITCYHAELAAARTGVALPGHHVDASTLLQPSSMSVICARTLCIPLACSAACVGC